MCPQFALDTLRELKLRQKDNQLTQIQDYKFAMSVSSYNKKRSIVDIDDSKRWIHGTRKFLRPDTFWADDRYVDVSLDEIDSARSNYESKN